MTFTLSITLFFSMVAFALIPGPGILTVTARSVSVGFRHGATTAVGIVAGDYFFITLALLGLTALSNLLGGFFVVVKYLGAAYLLWLGISLILSKPSHTDYQYIVSTSYLNSFFAGLIATVGNPKAILFYAGFLPAFIDLSSISLLDMLILYGITAASVGSVTIAYAYFAHKAKTKVTFIGNARGIQVGSGAMLIGSGVYVAARG